jgi:hypothetical protein
MTSTRHALLLLWDGAELIADETGSLVARFGAPGARRVAAPAA